MPDLSDDEEPVLAHGGDLTAARRRFPLVRDWLDLSTGIAPWPYPVAGIDPALWARLPGRDLLDALAQEAARRYGAPSARCVAAAAGTQAVLHVLPRLRPPGRVAVVGFTYREHARCWRLAGHSVTEAAALAEATATADMVVLVNPNNPDGRTVEPAAVLAAADALAARGGWLVVDEAFADAVPEASVAPACERPGLVVLRSFGKFFGLAGARLGFALAAPGLTARLNAALGPWAVSGPAAEIGRRALADAPWIEATSARLDTAARRLRGLLAGSGLRIAGGTPLFVLAETDGAAEDGAEEDGAEALHEHLMRNGILVRRFAERPRWLRFGLPPDGTAEDRLRHCLRERPR